MKIRKALSLALATLLLTASFSTVFAEEAQTSSGIKTVVDFPDVLRTHNSYVAISHLAELGVLSGYPDGTFKPDNPINRAEVLKVILNGSNVEAPETFGEVTFPDFQKGDWFARFVMKAKALGIVKGNDADGTFAPGRQVNKAEFLKMLLMANQIRPVPIEEGGVVATDISNNDWFAPYLHYAFQVGLITKDDQGNLNPGKLLTRGEVSDMMYLLILIKGSKDTQFLLHRAESETAQIEVYIAANKVTQAKRASELAVDLTQQAYKNMSDNNVVLGAAKLARSYDWLVDAFIYGIQKDYALAAEWANKAIDKATEAWEANNATQPIARHIKDRAGEILAQVEGAE
ncbi:S-layer homology domain-containing protein [Candidatus Pacearchaeota archaeon]|nr:S-layer homology domain-containing protein [Candidatus Pacearchaeota archaeon]